jgi:hypothetical protein
MQRLRKSVHQMKPARSKKLHARPPQSLREANEWIASLHRHHKPVQGQRFSIAVYDDEGTCHGVAIVGRPVARALDPTRFAEVTRLVTDGFPNACSFLYAACAQACRAMGFEVIQTYILEEEPGTSLKAAGWSCDGIVRKDGVGWNNRDGRRADQPTGAKSRWRKSLNFWEAT